MRSFARPARLSLEEFERLPDEDRRAELVRGRLVREPLPGFAHGDLAARIAFLVGRHVYEHGLGRVLVDAGFVLREDPPTVRGPDVAFVARDRVAEARRGPTGFARIAPDLAVEVASPSNRVSRMQRKVVDYLDADARLVWVVEPATRTVTVYRPGGEVRLLRAGDELDGGDVLPGLRLPLAEVFEA